jgi:hypothetical protein
MILILLGLLLGILLQLGILLPDVVLSALNSLFGYSILLAATLGVYAIYSQVKLLKHIASNKDRIHFIATCILLLPTLYPLVVGVLMLSVAFQLP